VAKINEPEFGNLAYKCKDGRIRRKLLVAAAPADYKQRAATRQHAPLHDVGREADQRGACLGEEKEHGRDLDK